MLIALEILGYGVIITLAIWYLMVARVKDRMAIPTLSAGVAFLGCLTYALLSSDNGHFWHFFSAGLLLAGLLLVKGLAGPLASGIILSLATYGLLHGTGSHIPLVQQLVMFVFGEVHLAIEYIAVIIMVLVSAVSTAVSLNDLFDFF
ncbi:MAG: hypothetical protein KKG33_05260 [candidate division Zixibacteria bacterium]|nr:hypothetical protein [candidate division Zixibacteria bacterium]